RLGRKEIVLVQIQDRGVGKKPIAPVPQAVMQTEIGSLELIEPSRSFLKRAKSGQYILWINLQNTGVGGVQVIIGRQSAVFVDFPTDRQLWIHKKRMLLLMKAGIFQGIEHLMHRYFSREREIVILKLIFSMGIPVVYGINRLILITGGIFEQGV